jgi:hypothetical protein
MRFCFLWMLAIAVLDGQNIKTGGSWKPGA